MDEEAIHQEVPMPIVPDAISLEEYTPGSNSEPSLSSARPQDFQRVRLLRRLLFKCYGCKRQVKELVQPLGNPSSEVYDYPGRKYQPGSDKSLAEAFCTDCVSQQNISSITRIVKDIFTVLLTRGTRGIGAIDQVLANDDRCKSPFTFAVVRETLKNMDFMWDSEEVKSLTINRPEGKSLAIQEGTCSCRETEEKNCGSCDVVKEGKTIEVSEVLPSGLFVEGISQYAL